MAMNTFSKCPEVEFRSAIFFECLAGLNRQDISLMATQAQKNSGLKLMSNCKVGFESFDLAATKIKAHMNCESRSTIYTYYNISAIKTPMLSISTL